MIKTRAGLADDTNGEHHEEHRRRLLGHLEELICTFFVPVPEPLDFRKAKSCKGLDRFLGKEER